MTTAGSASGKTDGMGWLDSIVVLVYLGFVAGLGIYFSRRQKTTAEYFLANRRIPGWVVGFSLLGTMIGSTTFVGHPGNVFNSDMWILPNHLMLPLMMVFVARYLVIFYRRVVKMSAYAYLEKRFGYPARVYGSLAFILSRIVDVAGTFFFLAITIAAVTEYDLWWVILVIGLITVIYTLIGGIEAVVWSDVVQGTLLVGGGLCLLGSVFFASGVQPGQLISTAWEGGKFGLGDWTFSLTELNQWMLIPGGLLWALQRYGCDQHMIQRYLLARSDKEAVRGAYFGAVACVPIWLLFMLVGALIWAYYQVGPDDLPSAVMAGADSVVPYFIKTHFPPGMIGLMVAALIAAAMSSLDSDLNSLGAVVVDDYYTRLRPGSTDIQRLWCGRIVICVLGVAAIVVSQQFVGIKSLIETSITLFTWVGAGMLGLFVLGFCFPRATSRGALVGIIACVLFTIWAAGTGVTLPGMERPLLNLGRFSYALHPYLIGIFGHVVMVTVGLTASLFTKPPSKETAELTIWQVRAAKDTESTT